MSGEQCIVVTGATRGLGLAIARRLKSAGYAVVATGRKCTAELESLIDEQGAGRVLFREFDLRETGAIQSFVKGTVAETGGLYGLVNNAAVGHDGVLATMHQTEIEELIRVNLLSAVLLTKYVVRSLLLGGGGRIVNISSIIASTGFNGLSVYGATKAAMAGFTRSLARELGKANITVNTVAPGYMQTDMTGSLDAEKLKSIQRRSPLGRLVCVEEVAAAVAFLVGPDGRSITGATFTVDAGSTA
jgi:3-oxoacyl-[acyl-carrier protein] reductase